jgi:hypothetical protein
MFTQEELIVLHKSMSELVIKGSEAATTAQLISKITTIYNAELAEDKPSKPKSGK